MSSFTLFNGELPTLFNISYVRKKTSVLATSVATETLQVSSSAEILTAPAPNTNNAATTQYVDEKINSLLGTNVVGVLDTISELSASLNSDPSFANTVAVQLAGKATLNQVNTFTQNNKFPYIELGGLDLGSRLTNDESNITALQTDNTSNKLRLTGVETDVSGNKVHIASLQTDVSSNKLDISSLQIDNTSNKSRLSYLETDVSGNKLRISSLQTDVSNNKIDISSLQTDNYSNQSRLTSLETDVSGNIINIALLQTDVSSNKLDISSLQTDVSGNKISISSLQTDVSGNKISISSLQTDVSENKISIISLQTDVSSNIVRLGLLETDVSGNKTSISTLNSDVSTINSTLPSKANLVNPTFSNNISVTGTATLNQVALNSSLLVNGETVSPAQLGYLSNLAGDIDDRFNSNETNISSHTTSINTINSTLPTKADDNVVVKLSGNQSVAGVKTFVSSLIVPDISLNDTNLQKVINKKYCDDRIADLVNSAPENLNTLNELANALATDASFSTTVTNTLATKAPIASPTFTGIASAATAAQGNNSTQIATTAYCDTGLSSKANLISPAITGTATFENIVVSGNGSIQGQLNGTGNSVIGDTSVDTLTVNSTSTFNAPITVAAGQSITTPTLTLNGTDLQTRLNAKLDGSTLSAANTFSGSNTFSAANIFSGSNTFSGATNTFSNTLDCNNIDTVTNTAQNNIYDSTTTGNTFLLNNASHSGNLAITNTGTGILSLRDNGAGTVNIATNTTGSTSTVNIGRSDGANTVKIGAHSFTGSNITLPSTFVTPSAGQIGYRVAVATSGSTELTSGIITNLLSITVSPGIWVASGFVQMGKTTAGSSNTILSTADVSISTSSTAFNGIYVHRITYGTQTSIPNGLVLSSTSGAFHQYISTTRTFTFTATTTIYLNVRSAFNIGTSEVFSAVSGNFEAIRIA